MIKLHKENRRKNEGEKLLELLPQGEGSGLDADTVDGLHVEEIIDKASPTVFGGGGGSGMAQHGNEFHTPVMEEYAKIKGKTVDDAAIGDGKVLTYKIATDKIEYTTPSGSGDMTKAAYDTTTTNSKVDTALNAEKLNSHTEAQVQNHAVTDANLSANAQDAVSKRHSQNSDTDLDATFEATFEKVANKNVASGYAGLSASSKVAASQMAAGTVVITLAFSISGALTTGQKTQRLLAPCAITLTKVRLVVDTAPTGANLIVDVHTGTGAGTTIFTTQGNCPTIVAGAKTGVSVAPDVTSIAEADEFSVYVDAVGSTIAGSDLTIEVIGTQAVVFV